jgi:hypothetical protein
MVLNRMLLNGTFAEDMVLDGIEYGVGWDRIWCWIEYDSMAHGSGWDSWIGCGDGWDMIE